MPRSRSVCSTSDARVATRGTLRKRGEQIASEAEYLFGVTEDNPAHIGRNQGAARFLQQLLTETHLQRLQLRTDGRSGQVEHFGRLDDAPCAHDGPEVEEMLVIEAADAAHDTRNFCKHYLE